ncbi:Uncharacterised protein [Mycobacteroides abscessus subsp. abscessus]|nr:Uncharacterised protein [Mycobacteroides abscessus subsp. abscessus]
MATSTMAWLEKPRRSCTGSRAASAPKIPGKATNTVLTAPTRCTHQ